MMLTKKTELFIIIGMIGVALILSILFLIFTDPSHIDSDNDGIMNDKDIFPNDRFESNDSDSDGVGDNTDKFIDDPAASKDSDEDGFPDSWNPGKSKLDSTSIPPLTLDQFPFDPFEHADSDGDGVGDNSDVFPRDPTESFDIDMDGVGDNKDINKHVDIGFSLNLQQFKVTRFVDILPRAQIYIVLKVNDEIHSIFDNNGQYYKVWLLQQRTINEFIEIDLDDLTGHESTTIEIIMYDYDLFQEDDLVDINPDTGKKSLLFTLDHLTNTIHQHSDLKGPQAWIDYSFTLPDYQQEESSFLSLIYTWSYQGRKHTVSLQVSEDKYHWYEQRNVNRSPQYVGKEAMKDFITEEDEVIQQLSTLLFQKALELGYNEVETIDFILTFTQQNINYQDDILSHNVSEYWKYPIETLVEKNGDCEDSSILFQSIMKNLDYNVVMLFYVIDNDTGHLSTGIALNETFSGNTVEHENQIYYYCETTSNGYGVGDKPEEIPDGPELIIDL